MDHDGPDAISYVAYCMHERVCFRSGWDCHLLRSQNVTGCSSRTI